MFRIVVVSLLVAGLIGLAAVVAVPYLAPRLIAWQLRSLGLEESMVGRADVGTDRVVLERVGLAPGLSADRVVLSYAPFELIRGRLGELRIDGLRVEARIGPTGQVEIPGVSLGGEAGAGPVLPLLPDVVRLEDAALSLAVPGGSVEIAGNGRLEVERDGPDPFQIDAERITARMNGRAIHAHLSLAGELEPFAENPLATLHGTGSGRFEADGLELDGAGNARAAGTVDLTIDDRIVTLGTEDLMASVEPPESSAVLDTFGISGPVEVALADDQTAALEFDLQESAGRLSLPLHLQTDGPSGDLDLDLRFDAGAGFDRLALDEMSLVFEAIEFPSIERLHLELQGAGTWTDATLDGQLTVDAADEARPFGVGDLELAVPLRIAVAPERVEVALPEPGRLRADGGEPAGGAASPTARLVLPAASVFTLDRTADLPWRFDLAASVEELRLGTAGTPVEADTGRLTLVATGDAAGAEELRLLLDGGAVILPDQEIALAGVRFEVPLGTDGRPAGAVPVTVARLRSLAEPAPFAPVKATGTVRLEPDSVGFEGALSRNDIELSFDGHYRLDRPDGRITVALPAIRFAPGKLQPGDLVPLAKGWVAGVSGVVSLGGSILLGSERLESDLDLTVRDLGLVSGPVRVERLDGVIELDQLGPLSTLPAQQIAIGLFNFGLPFTDGLMRYELLPGGPLDVRMLRFDWAGGRIRGRPFTVGSADHVINLNMEASGLDLELMFDQVGLPGLEGQGTIDGVLPVEIEGSEASIEDGRLTARRPGWLRYRPESPPDAFAAAGESVTLLLQAMENFRYDELEITLDGRTDQKMDVRLHLKGANPDLYGAQPIEFNLNLEGELGTILREGLRSYTLPDRVREQLERRKRR